MDARLNDLPATGTRVDTVPNASISASCRFGRFELRAGERLLLADGAPVALGARAFDLLVAFVDRPGTLLTKDELLETVWPGVVVEENNIQVQVSTLRKILGPTALATIPGRGYRFNLPVTCASTGAPLRVGDEQADIVEGLEMTGRAASSTNLPPRLPHLFGREGEVEAITALLRDHPVVTIAGAGGIGKTRVAQAVAKSLIDAANFTDGVWWIELAALADGALAPSAVAQAMGLQVSAEASTTSFLESYLATRRALLVLDNCEHLADAVSQLVDALIAAGPHIKVLVTSQETLRATDEQVYRLPGLELPESTDVSTALQSGAIELFVARAQAADPRFKLTSANCAAVVEICRRLDGIPLAIELAAARLPLLGVEGLRARLHERFNLLTGGARVVLRRHQTLRATLEWSHGLLTPHEQTVFRRLGVFAGGFTLEAAQQVASDERVDPWTTLDHLGALVDKSLVIAEGEPVPRYRMLESTRAYAMERLAEAGEMQATLRRHAHAVLALLEPLEQDDWTWRNTGAVVPAAAAELDNLRAALKWADAAAEGPLAVALAGVSYSVWWSAFQLAEGLARCVALRPHVETTASAAIVARFWLTVAKLGVYSTQREGYDAAVRAAALYRELGDHRLLFEALTFAAVQGTRFATVEQMEAEIHEAAQLEQAEWPARQRAKLHFARCFWFARQHRFEEALASAQLQVAICREGGAEIGALYATSNVALMEALVGRPAEALEHSSVAIARLHALGDDARASHLYFSKMLALLLLDRSADALLAAHNAYPRLLLEADHHRMLLPLAVLHAMEGRLDTAVRIEGFDRAIQTRTEENESPWAPLLRTRLDPLLSAGLSSDERARLAAEGAALRDEDGFRMALGDGPPGSLRRAGP